MFRSFYCDFYLFPYTMEYYLLLYQLFQLKFTTITITCRLPPPPKKKKKSELVHGGIFYLKVQKPKEYPELHLNFKCFHAKPLISPGKILILLILDITLLTHHLFFIQCSNFIVI